MIRRPPRSTLFPYTRSSDLRRRRRCVRGNGPCDGRWSGTYGGSRRSEEHTSELQSLTNLVCRLLLEKKKKKKNRENKKRKKNSKSNKEYNVTTIEDKETRQT